MFKPKSILVPVDFSEPSELAFKQAVEISQIANANVTLLHVQSADLDSISTLYIGEDKVKEIKEYLKKEIEENMKNLISQAGNLDSITIKTVTLRGVPYDEIVKLSENGNYDLIVISSHGKNAIQTFLYGSTTEKVVRNAKCSVLVVR